MSGVSQQTVVRRITADDDHFLFGLARDPRVVRWVGDGSLWSREFFDERFFSALTTGALALGGSQQWFVASDSEGCDVGFLTLMPREVAIEIGYWIHPDHWRRGHAGRIIHSALELTNEQAPGVPIIARAHRDNMGSQRALLGAGFVVVPSAVTATANATATSGAAQQGAADPVITFERAVAPLSPRSA